MRVGLCLACLLLTLPAIQGGDAQTSSEPSIVVNFSDGGASPEGSGAMESIFLPPLENEPFSLQLTEEWSGRGAFTLVNERRVVRDSRGRIYQERRALVPQGSNIMSGVTVFQITDPDQHTWLNCSTRSEVCELLNYHLTTQMTYQPFVGESGLLSGGKELMLAEDLGQGTMLGMETHGYRTTVTYNPGRIGRDKPKVITREFWYSPKLGIDLKSMLDSPQTGKQVFSVKKLTTSEPDPALFEIPRGYKVVDHRANQDQLNTNSVGRIVTVPPSRPDWNGSVPRPDVDPPPPASSTGP